MLASVQKIDRIEPIAGADQIELAHVLGWQCIVRKGEFNPGDLCVYVEIDTLLPPRPEWEWLRTRCLKVLDGVEWFKIRTIKMKGVYSQGLALPVTLLKGEHTEGDDVSEELGAQKFEKRVFTGTTADGKQSTGERFPNFLIKTDQTNVQNIQPWLDALADTEFEVTIKIDGTSATFFRHREFGVCSRNLWLVDEIDCAYWFVAEKYGLADVVPEHAAVQAEIYGPGIQDNNERATEYQMAVFDVLDVETQRYWFPDEVEAFCKKHELPYVPVLHRDIALQEFGGYDALIKAASGPSVNTKRKREGIVFKSYGYKGQLQKHVWTKMLSQNVLVGGRISFKVCALDFLAKEP